MDIIKFIQRNRWPNAAVKHLRMHSIFDAVVSRMPIRRRTANGYQYLINSAAALVSANEMFHEGPYAAAIKLIAPRTFVDIGANVGFFPILLADLTNSTDLKGLLIEANPSLIQPLAYHLKVNGLSSCKIVEGAATDQTDTEIDFYLNPSNIASSVSGDFNPVIPTGGRVLKIKVAAVDVAREWEAFANAPIDLIKIDIEGGELKFLCGHQRLLSQTRAVVLEWHKWVCSFSEVEAILSRENFLLHSILEEDSMAGIALFVRAAAGGR